MTGKLLSVLLHHPLRATITTKAHDGDKRPHRKNTVRKPKLVYERS